MSNTADADYGVARFLAVEHVRPVDEYDLLSLVGPHYPVVGELLEWHVSRSVAATKECRGRLALAALRTATVKRGVGCCHRAIKR